MNFTVQRGDKTAQSTPGKFLIDFKPLCYTLEPVDPMPAGTYEMYFRDSAKFGRPVIGLKNVPGHTDIEIHGGNTAKDTHDCVLVGMQAGVDVISGCWEALLKIYSFVAFEIIKGNKAWLEIKE